jgi:hypothetical protein
MRGAWILFSCALASCLPSTSSYVRGPDGHAGWVSVECGGSQTACYERAAAECPGGYDIADSHGTSNTHLIAGYRGGMLVRCHPWKGAHQYDPAAKAERKQGKSMPCDDDRDCPWTGYQCVEGQCSGE